MASGKVPPVLALAAAISVAAILGIAGPSQLFAGLSNGGVITVAAMLVIAKGVIHTGVVTRVAWRLLSSVTTASQTLGRLILPVGAASAMMNTTPIVAMLIPAVKELQQTRGIPARQVLLPIAHVTTLAGSTTLVGTSSNLLIAGIASGSGVEVGMFSFAIIALPVAIVGWAWLLFASPRAFKASDDAEEKEMTWRVEIPVSARPMASAAAPVTWAWLPPRSSGCWGFAARWRCSNRRSRSPPGTRWSSKPRRRVSPPCGAAPVRAGRAEQRLYAASVAPGEPGTINDLESHGKVDVVAAQTEDQLHEARVNAGDTIYPPATIPNRCTSTPTSAYGKTPQARPPGGPDLHRPEHSRGRDRRRHLRLGRR